MTKCGDDIEVGVTEETKYLLHEISAWADVLKCLGGSPEEVGPRSIYVIGEALESKIKELYEDLGIDPNEVRGI